jgi:hypothetical protein
MSNLKRDLVKYIRDRAKSGYDKGTECFICGSDELLDFHHYCSISEMFNKWMKKLKLNIETVEDILEHRDKFIEEHYEQMYNETVTLCHEHHIKLHTIYGRNPVLATAKKQARWVQKQRDKHGLV